MIGSGNKSLRACNEKWRVRRLTCSKSSGMHSVRHLAPLTCGVVRLIEDHGVCVNLAGHRVAQTDEGHPILHGATTGSRVSWKVVEGGRPRGAVVVPARVQKHMLIYLLTFVCLVRLMNHKSSKTLNFLSTTPILPRKMKNKRLCLEPQWQSNFFVCS